MKNSLLSALFGGTSTNISMVDIYSINHNESIYHLGIQSDSIDPSIIEVRTISSGGEATPMQLPLLSSNAEVCFSFDLSQELGTMKYKLIFRMFTNQAPLLNGFMSLPNQTRGFDRFQLFKALKLPENALISVAQSVFSLKVLERRTVSTEPCVATENYDQVLS